MTVQLPKSVFFDGVLRDVDWQTADDMSGWFATIKTGLTFADDDAAAQHFVQRIGGVDGVDSAKLHANGDLTLKIRA